MFLRSAYLGSYIVLFLLFCLFSSVSYSQTLDEDLFPTLEGNLQEDYSEEILMGTKGLLVGFALGVEDFEVSPSQILINLPRAAAEKRICFSVASRDGVYTAQSTLPINKYQSGLHFVGPMRNSIYLDQLSGYDSTNLATKAFIGESCSLENEKIYVPTVLKRNSDVLIAAFNTKRALRVQAWISKGTKLYNFTCDNKLKGRSASFDTLCVMPNIPNELSGKWTLSLRRIPVGAPSRVDDFSVVF